MLQVSEPKLRVPTQSAAVPEASGADVRYSSPVLLRVPHALPRFHPLDHRGTTRSRPFSRDVLQHPLLLPRHDLHQLCNQSHPVQPHVLEIPRWFLASLWPQNQKQPKISSRPEGNLQHDFHNHHQLLQCAAGLPLEEVFENVTSWKRQIQESTFDPLRGQQRWMFFVEKQVPYGVQCQEQRGADRRRASLQKTRRELRLNTSH